MQLAESKETHCIPLLLFNFFPLLLLVMQFQLFNGHLFSSFSVPCSFSPTPFSILQITIEKRIIQNKKKSIFLHHKTTVVLLLKFLLCMHKNVYGSSSGLESLFTTFKNRNGWCRRTVLPDSRISPKKISGYLLLFWDLFPVTY